MFDAESEANAMLDRMAQDRQAEAHATPRPVAPAVVTGSDDQDDCSPTPLPDALPPVARLKTALLPDALAGWLADTADRMQCPIDFPAIGAVVGLSSLVGARAVIQPKARDDWQVVPNLWGLIIGRPGVMKSPAISESLRPICAQEAAARDDWQEKHADWEVSQKIADMANRQGEKLAEKEARKDPKKARELLRPVEVDAEPTARRYIVNDATVEKLGELLQTNQWGLLCYRDEVHGLLRSMDRQGQEGARAFYLQSYDGNQSYTFDRIERGTIHIPRACISLLGGIQPGRLQSYIRDAVAGNASDDGLLQRFSMAVWPDISSDFVHVDAWPDSDHRRKAYEVFDRFGQLQPATDTNPHVWRFSDDAQGMYREWVTPFETEIRGETLHPSLVSHLAKYRKLVPALALLFALIDTPDNNGIINEYELARALDWAEYLRSHAERIYSAATTPETFGARTLLQKMQSGAFKAIGSMFTPRQVAVKHWAGLGTPEDVRKAADTLVDYGWLFADSVKTVGARQSDRYIMHSILIQGGAS